MLQHPHDHARIGLLVDRVAKLGRARKALGVPADMFAVEVHTGLPTVKLKHLVILLKYGCELLVEARIGPAPSPAELAHHLLDKPRATIGATANHHSVRARLT